MPSSKTPTALRVGTGKIPNNTVSVSALTSVPGVSVSSTPPPINVQAVSSVTTLTRVGQFMLVLVDASGGGFNLTLPTTSQVGDVIMLVNVSTSTSNVVNIARGGSDTIQGSANSQALVGHFTSRTLVRTSLTDWTFQSELPSVQTVTTSLTLTRGGKERIVLVDASAGAVTLTLPQSAQIGDRITVVKSVSTANAVTVDGNGGDTIDGRPTTVLSTFLQALVLVRVQASAWASLSETSSVIEVNDTLSLSSFESAKEIHLLVHTSNGAWVAGTKTLTLPSTTQSRVGQVVTISDVDGNAEAANINIAAGVLGTVPSGTAAYALTRNFAALTLVNKAAGNWTILDEDRGLSPNFYALSRAEGVRADISQSRLASQPMFNWSHRKVALHAEFNGLITNALPVEGFSAGGDMVLSAVSGVTGTVGMLRCTVPLGGAGYLHWGSSPSSAIFDPAQLMGFRAILRFSNLVDTPGEHYDVAVGFGQDISDTTGNIGSGTDSYLGTNSIFLGTGVGGVWRRVRRSSVSGSATGLNLTSITPGNRYVLEYYFNGSFWDSYINGVRSTAEASNANTPTTTFLNFGMMLRDDTGGTQPFIVDVDSFTVFTLDMGATRFT